MTRTLHSGNAAATTLNGSITAGATSLIVATSTGSTYPSPTGGQIAYLVLDAGTASEEKVSYSTRSGDTFSGLTRGVDGTTAQSHGSGASVKHPFTAQEADDANAHVNASSGVHGLAGAVVGTTDSQTLTHKDLTDATNTFPWSSAWTSYTPSFTNITSPTGFFAYKQIGKTLFIRGYFSGGTVTSTGVITISLPGGLTSVASIQQYPGSNLPGNLYYINPADTVVRSGTVTGGLALGTSGFTGVLEVQ